ncbi:MAG: YfhO family protein [Planctomycetota bacterium]
MNDGATTVREVLLAGTIALLVAVLFCARALAPGTVFLSTDVLYTAPPFNAHQPPGTIEHNPFLSDQATIYYPWLRYARERLWRGDFPLWTSESYGGVPFFGNLSTGLLFPLNWLHFLLPFHASFTIVPIMKIWLAGLFMFLFLRRLKLAVGAALLGAIAFQVSGFMAVWLQYALTHVACLMPMLFWAGERWRMQRRVRDAAVLAIVLALQFLAGHPESSLVLCASLVLYLVLREASAAAMLKRLASLALLGALALGMCAVQLLPFVEYLLRSEGQRLRAGHRLFQGGMAATLTPSGLGALAGALAIALVCRPLLRRRRDLVAGALLGVGVLLLTKAGMPPQALVQLLPNLYGNPLDGGRYSGPYTYTDLNGGFVGVTAVVLAMLAVVTVRSTAVRGLLAILVLTFGTAQHVPGIFHAVRMLPLFSLVAGTRFLLGTAFALAALAAHGAQALSGALPWRRVLDVAGAGVLVASAALLAASRLASQDDVVPGTDELTLATGAPADAARVEVKVDGGVLHAGAPLAEVAWLGSNRLEEGNYRVQVDVTAADGVRTSRQRVVRIERQKSVTRADVVAAAGGIAAVALALVLARRQRVHLAHGLLVLAVGGELFRFGLKYNAVSDAARVFPATRTTSFLMERVLHEPPFRILTEEKILQPNLHLPYCLPHMRGYDAMENRAYMAVVRWLFRGEEVPWTRWSAATMQYESPLFDLFGVRYILATQDLSRFAKLAPVMQADGLTIYENRDAMPRAFIVGQCIDVDSPERTRVDPRQCAIIDEPMALGGSGSARIVRYDSDACDVEVDIHGRALLVLTDNYFPGWRALVDGQERSVLRTHGTFRAVPVHEGDRLVRFVYRPWSVIGGAVLSALCALVAAWMLWRRSGTSRRQPWWRRESASVSTLEGTEHSERRNARTMLIESLGKASCGSAG